MSAPLEKLRDDVKHGLRRVRRNPAFTTAVVLLLSLGIGATTALHLTSSIDQRDSHSYMALARLADDTTPEQAQSEFDSIAAGLRATYPDTNEKSCS